MEELLDLELAAMRELFPAHSAERPKAAPVPGLVETEAELLDKSK
jgi:hypothetical protein